MRQRKMSSNTSSALKYKEPVTATATERSPQKRAMSITTATNTAHTHTNQKLWNVLKGELGGRWRCCCYCWRRCWRLLLLYVNVNAAQNIIQKTLTHFCARVAHTHTTHVHSKRIYSERYSPRDGFDRNSSSSTSSLSSLASASSMFVRRSV